VKIITTAILLGLLAFQIFLRAGLVGYYYVNQSYIAAAFCENKSNPQMHCNGKCYLKKQLKRADETEKSQNPLPSQRESTEAQPFICGESVVQGIPSAPVSFYANSVSRLISGFSTSVFHPPAA